MDSMAGGESKDTLYVISIRVARRVRMTISDAERETWCPALMDDGLLIKNERC